MTKIINGFAQPDITAEKGNEKIAVFVETPGSLRTNARALGRSLEWFRENEPGTRVDLVQTVPRSVGKQVAKEVVHGLVRN